MNKAVDTLLTFALLVVVLTVLTAVFIGAILGYGWLLTLISPLTLWQIAILLTIAFIGIILRSGEAIGNQGADILFVLLFGAPTTVAIGMFAGWFVARMTGIDLWHTTLLTTTLTTAIVFALLRIADKAEQMMRIAEDEQEGSDDEDVDSGTGPLDYDEIEQIMWLTNQRPRKRRRKRR